jgi:hypothetical protein
MMYAMRIKDLINGKVYGQKMNVDRIRQNVQVLMKAMISSGVGLD